VEIKVFGVLEELLPMVALAAASPMEMLLPRIQNGGTQQIKGEVFTTAPAHLVGQIKRTIMDTRAAIVLLTQAAVVAVLVQMVLMPLFLFKGVTAALVFLLIGLGLHNGWAAAEAAAAGRVVVLELGAVVLAVMAATVDLVEQTVQRILVLVGVGLAMVKVELAARVFVLFDIQFDGKLNG
jgi:hypothetical protein